MIEGSQEFRHRYNVSSSFFCWLRFYFHCLFELWPKIHAFFFDEEEMVERYALSIGPHLTITPWRILVHWWQMGKESGMVWESRWWEFSEGCKKKKTSFLETIPGVCSLSRRVVVYRRASWLSDLFAFLQIIIIKCKAILCFGVWQRKTTTTRAIGKRTTERAPTKINHTTTKRPTTSRGRACAKAKKKNV